jgi:mono/diheme cytochrome c family protein
MRRAVAALAFAALAAQPSLAQQGRVQRGQTFAQTHCAGCHAIGRTGESPLAIAPPFRTLHARYRVEDLAEAMAEGLTTGHPTMPEFVLDPAQINDLIAYLRSLEPARSRPRRRS